MSEHDNVLAMTPRLRAKAEYVRILEAADLDPDESINAVRGELDRNDLFFLLTVTLKADYADNDFVFERCREVQADPNDRLDLWFREGFKSTIITYALTIQDVLNNPEITIGIFSFSKPIAKAFLSQIKTEFENNEELKLAHPEVLHEDPKREAQKWSLDAGIVVKRKGNPRESTIEASGLVDGMPTSRHFDLLVYDDVVTKESVYTPEQIAKTSDSLKLSYNLGRRGGKRRMIGTPYAHADSYSEVMRRSTFKPRIHKVTKNGLANGEPVLLTQAQVDAKYADMGVYIFNCQMLINPTADGAMGFREEWLKYWPAQRWGGLNRIILVDPANDKKKTSDYTAMWVLGLGADRIVRVIDMVRDRLNLTERQEVLFALHKRYKPYFVGYEQYGMQADIAHHKSVMETETYHFTITSLGGPMPKPDRIRRLVPWFEQGKIWLPEICNKRDWEGRSVNLIRAFKDEEYLAFPFAGHDDMLDGLARLADEDVILNWPINHDDYVAEPAWRRKLRATDNTVGRSSASR